MKKLLSYQFLDIPELMIVLNQNVKNKSVVERLVTCETSTFMPACLQSHPNSSRLPMDWMFAFTKSR